MRKSILAILSIICFTATNAQLTKADEQKLNDLLKQMTIEEKVGQMTQVTFAAAFTYSMFLVAAIPMF